MNDIQTYNDLLLEKQRLQLLQRGQRIIIKAEFEGLKTRLKPVARLFEMISKITAKGAGNSFIETGIEIGVNFLLKKVLLRNAGWVARLFMPALVKNYLSNEITEKGTLVQKAGAYMKGVFTRIFKNHQPV